MPSIEQGNHAQPLPSAELNLGSTSTSEKQFLTASAFGQTASGQPLTCYLPGTNTIRQRPIKVRVGGRLFGALATNFTAKLYVGTSSTIASNTNIATSGAVATGGVQGSWGLDCDLVWDFTAGNIQGIFRGWIQGSAVAQVTVTNTANLTTLNAENSNNGFTITGTFSSGAAGNLAYVDWFEVVTL